MDRKRHTRGLTVDRSTDDLAKATLHIPSRYGSEDHRHAIKSLTKHVSGTDNTISVNHYGLLKKDKSVAHFSETWSRRGYKSLNMKTLGASSSMD
jgi:hypothetical protein